MTLGKGLLLTTGIGILGYSLYRYFKAEAALLMNYSYSILGVIPSSISDTNITLNITIRFTSTSDIQATVQKLYIDMYLNNVYAGNIVPVKPFIIPSKGSSDVVLSFSFNPKLILGNIVAIVMGTVTNKDMDLTMKGYATVKAGVFSTDVPVNTTMSLKQYLAKIPTI